MARDAGRGRAVGTFIVFTEGDRNGSRNVAEETDLRSSRVNRRQRYGIQRDGDLLKDCEEEYLQRRGASRRTGRRASENVRASGSWNVCGEKKRTAPDERREKGERR